MTSAGEVEQESQPRHPGWQPLTTVLDTTTPFFEKLLFLRSFEAFSSNIYVIMGEYVTIVDPGNDYTAFMDLFTLNVKPEGIKKLVLTHGHPDHALGAFELLRSYPSLVQGGGFELILHEAAPPQLKELVKELGSRVTEVRGGETLELSGLEWEVIHTPGHTIDGICLYHAATKTVFSGDMALPYGVGAPDPNAGGRLDHYLFGLKALLKRDVENLLPGHGPPVAPGGRKIIEETYECVMMKIIGVENPIPWIEGAKALAQKGLLGEAVFCCDKELASHPENLKALELKALCLNDMDRNAEAIEVFDKLLARGSDNVYALTGKGRALMGLGQYDESLSYFEDALEYDPNIREALISKGMALYLSGRYEEAMDVEAFSTEFASRIGGEVRRRTQASGPSEDP